MLGFFVLIIVLLIGFIFFIKHKLNYNNAPITVHQSFPLAGEKNIIMCLFPHPDDEISVAGTLYKLSQNTNNQLVGVYLTRGEAGSTGGLVAKEDLGRERSKELENAGKIVGYGALEIFDFPDSGLPNTDSTAIKTEMLRMIYKYKPNIIISFDDKAGLYGHKDHIVTSKLIQHIFRENATVDSFPIRQLYCPTLSEGMLGIALSMSSTFKKNYPKDPSKGLPAASFAVEISSVGDKKLQAIQAHRTQKSTFTDVFPLHDKVSPHFYFYLFDREYFALLQKR